METEEDLEACGHHTGNYKEINFNFNLRRTDLCHRICLRMEIKIFFLSFLIQSSRHSVL